MRTPRPTPSAALTVNNAMRRRLLQLAYQQALTQQNTSRLQWIKQGRASSAIHNDKPLRLASAHANPGKTDIISLLEQLLMSLLSIFMAKAEMANHTPGSPTPSLSTEDITDPVLQQQLTKTLEVLDSMSNEELQNQLSANEQLEIEQQALATLQQTYQNTEQADEAQSAVETLQTVHSPLLAVAAIRVLEDEKSAAPVLDLLKKEAEKLLHETGHAISRLEK